MTGRHAASDTARFAGRATARPSRARAFPLFASCIAAAALLFLHSCQNPDPVAKQKERILTPDERYLVDYYMKIMELEKIHHDNQASREEKRKELDENLDRERVRRILAELEKEPERWLAIYYRINELHYRALQRQSSASD